MDAMGHLVKVTEPNPAGGADVATDYTYNPRDRLAVATMTRGGTTQNRYFNYDGSTDRLTSVVTPESGTVSYTYHGWGGLASKTDARNQQVQYSYDSFRRVTQIRRYEVAGGAEDTCQRVDFYYDANPFDGGYTQNPKGRLAATRWAATACSGGEWREMYSYSTGGLAKKKRLVRVNYNRYLEAVWTYDNEGKVVSVAYPNGGRTYTYTFDAMGRPIKLTDNSAVDWAKDVVYGPAGEMTGIKYTTDGTNNSYYTETRTYNNLLQLTRLTVPGVMDIEYRFTAGQNNGRISQMKDWVSGEEVTYQYDSLVRLISAQTTGPEWGQSFGYDGFGNLLSQTVTKGSAPTLQVNVDAATNRITTGGYSYDANGNVTAMPLLTMSYDVENRLKEATHSSNGMDKYRYDPASRRVWHRQPNLSEVTVFYGLGGERMGRYSGTTAFTTLSVSVYFAGKLIWDAGAGVVTDRLGSARSGNRKYFPYGEEPVTTAQDKTKFATYFRDATTALDYADQRYYGRTMGRFLTPDPYGGSANPADPQSWNRYAYVTGDPVNFVDPSGLDKCAVDLGFPVCFTVTKTEIVDLSYFHYAFSSAVSVYDFGRPAELRNSTGSVADPTVDDRTNDIARKLFEGAIAKMRKTRCDELFPLGAILSTGLGVDFYDARPIARFARRTQDYVSGNGNQTRLENTGKFGDYAVVLMQDLEGSATRLLNKVVLKANWWSDGKDPFTLVHEVLHIALNAGDESLMSSFRGSYGFMSMTGYSGDITAWLEGGCKKMTGMPRGGGRDGARMPIPRDSGRGSSRLY